MGGGPSLRVQGEPKKTGLTARPLWAIPARAGRTSIFPVRIRYVLGHPCACRENCLRHLGLSTDLGPSLRVQGEPPMEALVIGKERAIPARAGRTR